MENFAGRVTLRGEEVGGEGVLKVDSVRWDLTPDEFDAYSHKIFLARMGPPNSDGKYIISFDFK